MLGIYKDFKKIWLALWVDIDYMLYSHIIHLQLYTYTCRNITTTGHSSLEKYSSHFIWKGCLWKVSWRPNKDCNILTPQTLLAITAFLSRSPGLLNWGLGAQPPLEHGSHSSIFSPTDLNFLSPGLYNNFTPTLLPASVTISHSIQPLDSQGRPWSPDIFDRIHLLFTLVHFLFWQLGRVRGQYATIRCLHPQQKSNYPTHLSQKGVFWLLQVIDGETPVLEILGMWNEYSLTLHPDPL